MNSFILTIWRAINNPYCHNPFFHTYLSTYMSTSTSSIWYVCILPVKKCWIVQKIVNLQRCIGIKSSGLYQEIFKTSLTQNIGELRRSKSDLEHIQIYWFLTSIMQDHNNLKEFKSGETIFKVKLLTASTLPRSNKPLL